MVGKSKEPSQLRCNHTAANHKARNGHSCVSKLMNIPISTAKGIVRNGQNASPKDKQT